jgi:hypothetical protein
MMMIVIKMLIAVIPICCVCVMCTLIMSIQSIQPAFAFKQNNQTHPHAKQAKAINPQTSPIRKKTETHNRSSR